MKGPVLCTTIAVAAGTGLGMGWLLWGGREVPADGSSGRIARSIAGIPGTAAERKTTEAAQQAHAAEVVARELEKLKTLPVEAYGRHMADVWLDHFNVDNQLRSSLCLATCDADQAMAFYREIKRRKGLSFEEWPGGAEGGKLCDFLILVGKRDGKNLMNQMMAAAPRGIAQLQSLMHGWAAAKPHEAVDWLNELPADSPYSRLSLLGLMWGLAESSPGTALEVYRKLDPADRNDWMTGQLVTPTVANYGMKGLVELVSGVTDVSERQELYTAAVQHGMNQPPGEFVKWMAEPLESAPYLQDGFRQMAARWSEREPEEAMQWLAQAAKKPGGDTALSIMAASLTRQGKADGVKAWLAANPQAPGHTAIENGMSGAAWSQ